MPLLDFDEHFKFSITALKVIGVYPNTKFSIHKALIFLILFALYTFFWYLIADSVINYYLKNNDYFNAFRNVVPVTFYFGMNINYILLYTNRKTIGKMIEYIKSDYNKLSALDENQRATVFKYVKKTSWILKRWLFLTSMGVATFVIKNIILSVILLIKDEYKRVQFHDMKFPDFIEDHKDSSFSLFVTLYALGLMYVTICGIIAYCSVPIGLITMLHACGQLELIKMKFHKLFENENVEENLKDIIKEMQDIYGFVDDINKCSTTMYEILLKRDMFLIPLAAYALVQSLKRGDFTAEYISIFFGALCTSGMPCYYGDLLMEKGEELAQAAYECGWEKVYNIKARKTLLIILTRTTRPIAVRSIFCTMNLDTLANVLRQSYAIFNIMTAAEGH